jgi:Protein of unknown function (DUF2852)
MTNEAYASGPQDNGFADRFQGGFRGPPLPVKLIGLGVAFLIARPLGVAVLAFLLYKAARRHWGGDWGRFGGWSRQGSCFRTTRPGANSAMDEKRRATLEALAEEEKAFSDFEHRQREAKDREAFDRFVAERNATKGQA